MADKPHSFASSVTWDSARRGEATAVGRPAITVGAPADFGGTDDVWSPEHLTVAALNTCLMLSFIAVAENSKLSFTAYSAEATATLGRVEGRGTAITTIVVRPRITVPAETDRGRLDRVLQLAKKNCFISNSLHSDVRLEPEIVTA